MKHERTIHILIFLGIILPLVAIEYFSYRELEAKLTEELIADRQAVVSLSATILKERFDRVKDLAVSLTTRVRFRSLVKQGRWEHAIAILREVPRDFPFVDRIFLSDTTGTLITDYPALPDVRGRNFAFRDWYTGVRADWTPYVSEVYQRAASPQINVVTISCAIREPEGNKVMGILVIQIALETLVDWVNEISVGNTGYVFVVDHTGKLAAHHRQDPRAEALDNLDHVVIPSVLGGEQGVRILQKAETGESLLIVFAPVPGYGWAVIAEEPEDSAFASQQASLRPILYIYTAMLILAAILAWLIIHTIAEHQSARAEIARLNKSLEQRAFQLEETNKELEAFSYSVSHDLRAPLRHIDGFVQLLGDKVSSTIDDEGKRFIEVISESARTMGQLISELLIFSRTGRTEMRNDNVPMNQLVDEILTQHETDIQQRNVQLTKHPLPVVRGDTVMLRQVWMNLLSNAFKYTRKTTDPVIEIGYRRTNGEHVFSVSDNGAGFDMKYAAQLFGVFQRLHGTDEFEGTGIGLAIVKRIVLRHNGRVWAEGVVGRGATFSWSLPEHSTEP